MEFETRIIDNRTLVLGLDGLYRNAIKKRERTELLACARHVASALAVHPADVPIEGYYGEDALLTEYFKTVRALQEVDGGRRPAVANLPAYERLKAVTSSPLFGRSEPDDHLFPRGKDALYYALLQTPAPLWTVPEIMGCASAFADNATDLSLVGLAVLTRDPMIVVAVRESVVLYAAVACTACCQLRQPRYVWRVDLAAAQRAARIVDTFNRLFGPELPQPVPNHAEHYWFAAQENRIDGRCVWIGCEGTSRKYHWAIRRGRAGHLEMHDFWSPDAWTTARYRASTTSEPVGAALRG